jgi:glycosyltransferase 2 family protein
MIRKARSKDLKKKIEIFCGIFVTLAALYFCMTALNGLNPSTILNADINWWIAGISAIIFAFSTFIRALVYPYGIDKSMTVMEAWQIVAIGNATNMILPFHAGEGVRLAVFPKRYSAANRARLAVIPGIADICFMLLISIAAVYIADFKAPSYVLVLKIASYGFLACCALMFIILLSINKTRAAVMSYFNRETLQMIKWVALSWLCMILSIWAGFISFGYAPLRSIVLTFGAMAGMNIAGLIPSSPGNLGIFEWSVTVGLAGLGISEIPAKMAGLMLHLIQYAALLPLGIVLYARFFFNKNRKRTFLFTHGSPRRAIVLKKY